MTRGTVIPDADGTVPEGKGAHARAPVDGRAEAGITVPFDLPSRGGESRCVHLRDAHHVKA